VRYSRAVRGHLGSPWQRFLAAPHTLGPTAGAREAWHRGRATYAVWAFLLDDPRVSRRCAAVAARLLAHGARPAAQPHVTVFVAGFPCPAASRDDDVTLMRLERQRARAAALDVRPLLTIGGATSFLTCAVLEVSAELAPLRAALAAESREVRFEPYLPHVTAAIYQDSRPTAPLAAALEPLRELEPFEVRPCGLDLVVFDARRAGAPLASAARVGY